MEVDQGKAPQVLEAGLGALWTGKAGSQALRVGFPWAEWLLLSL